MFLHQATTFNALVLLGILSYFPLNVKGFRVTAARIALGGTCEF